MGDNIPDPEPGCSVDGCERENCDRCGYHTFLSVYVGDQQLCSLCAGVPDGLPEDRFTRRLVCYVGNFLLDALAVTWEGEYRGEDGLAPLQALLGGVERIAGGHE